MQPHQAILPRGDEIVENIGKIASATSPGRKAIGERGKVGSFPQSRSQPHDSAHRLWIMGIAATTQRSQALLARQAVGIFGTNA
jgi:hypothetical protein